MVKELTLTKWLSAIFMCQTWPYRYFMHNLHKMDKWTNENNAIYLFNLCINIKGREMKALGIFFLLFLFSWPALPLSFASSCRELSRKFLHGFHPYAVRKSM